MQIHFLGVRVWHVVLCMLGLEKSDSLLVWRSRPFTKMLCWGKGLESCNTSSGHSGISLLQTTV